MIERSHLEIMRTIKREGSLTAAANRLCLTQSALSHSIKKLEVLLGASVWEKDGRSLRFTPAGEYLLSLADRLLPQFEHAELLLGQMANGQKGVLRIGMECHPCYRWLLKVVAPYLELWRNVDVDVVQKFKFGGMRALYTYEIDILVTPDPLRKPGVIFTPVFGYEQVLVVAKNHHLANNGFVTPSDMVDEVLITYPVERERLDIFSQFLTPARCTPRKQKNIETTDIMLEMVAAARGVAALPRWLVEEYAGKLDVVPLSLGQKGVHKEIHLGIREDDRDIDYVRGFLALAAEQKKGLQKQPL